MTAIRPRRALITFAVVAGVFLAACGGSSDDSTNGSAAPAGGGGSTVVIEGFAYSPNPITVKAGTTITVENKDSATHTLTADDGSLDTGNLAQGESGTITVPATGEIAYHCAIHDYMKGVIRVEA